MFEAAQDLPRYVCDIQNRWPPTGSIVELAEIVVGRFLLTLVSYASLS